MSNEPNIRINAAVLCDDVRREDNGKEIIIGVYSGSIVVPHLPSRLVLQLWINVEVVRGGKGQLLLRIIDKRDVVLGQLDATIEIDTKFPVGSLPSPKFPIEVAEETTLRFQWKLGSGRWQTLLTKPLVASHQTEASSPPSA